MEHEIETLHNSFHGDFTETIRYNLYDFARAVVDCNCTAKIQCYSFVKFLPKFCIPILLRSTALDRAAHIVEPPALALGPCSSIYT